MVVTNQDQETAQYIKEITKDQVPEEKNNGREKMETLMLYISENKEGDEMIPWTDNEKKRSGSIQS